MKRGKFLSVCALCLFCIFLNPLVSYAETILILRPIGPAFDDVQRGLQGNLDSSFTTKVCIKDKSFSIAELKVIIDSTKPRIVLLMDNTMIHLYKEYCKTNPIIPSVSLMAAMVSKEMAGMKDAEAISYEVPIVTSVVQLRTLLNMTNVNIGIIHREFLADFVKESREWCKKENIELTGYFVPSGNADYGPLLQKGLDYIASGKSKVNMLWVPNDIAFLKPDMIRNIWIPFSQKCNIPIIVGVDKLLSSDASFGTFAVLPDHESLGSQAAEMIGRIKDQGWHIDAKVIEPPISIFKIISNEKVSRYEKVNTKMLEQIDKSVK